MGIPGPTQTLPPQYSLTFQVTTNGRTTDPLTYVAINGGNGMNFVTDVEAILTTPDGTSQSQTMKQPHYSGQNVSFPCSTWQNRVEIWTTSPEVGRIKVYDELVPVQVTQFLKEFTWLQRNLKKQGTIEKNRMPREDPSRIPFPGVPQSSPCIFLSMRKIVCKKSHQGAEQPSP